MKKTCSNFDGNNDISSRQELEGYPPRPPAALLSFSAPNALKFGGGLKEMTISNNFYEEHFAKFRLHQCHFIQPKCFSAAVQSTKSIVGHYINNQLPNE